MSSRVRLSSGFFGGRPVLATDIIVAPKLAFATLDSQKGAFSRSTSAGRTGRCCRVLRLLHHRVAGVQQQKSLKVKRFQLLGGLLRLLHPKPTQLLL